MKETFTMQNLKYFLLGITDSSWCLTFGTKAKESGLNILQKEKGCVNNQIEIVDDNYFFQPQEMHFFMTSPPRPHRLTDHLQIDRPLTFL